MSVTTYFPFDEFQYFKLDLCDECGKRSDRRFETHRITTVEYFITCDKHLIIDCHFSHDILSEFIGLKIKFSRINSKLKLKKNVLSSILSDN